MIEPASSSPTPPLFGAVARPAEQLKAAFAERMLGAGPSARVVLELEQAQALLQLLREQVQAAQAEATPQDRPQTVAFLFKVEGALTTLEVLRSQADPATVAQLNAIEETLRQQAVALALNPPRQPPLVGAPVLSASARETLVEAQYEALLDPARQTSPADRARLLTARASAHVALAHQTAQEAGRNGPAQADAVARAEVASALGVPADALELGPLGRLSEAQVSLLGERLRAMDPAAQAVAARMLRSMALDMAAHGRPGLLVVSAQALERAGLGPSAAGERALVEGELALASGDFAAAHRAYDRAIQHAEAQSDEGRMEAVGLAYAQAASAALAHVASVPPNARAGALVRLSALARGATLELGADAVGVRLLELSGAAYAGEGVRARALLTQLRAEHGQNPAVKAQLDAFEARYQQAGWTAAAETLVAELSSASLAESAVAMGGGAAGGAVVGTWVCPGVGTAGGAAIGYLVGLGGLMLKKGVEGSHRIDEAWRSGIDIHTPRETAMNAALVALDVVELGAPAAAALKLGKGAVRAALLGRRAGLLGESGLEVLAHTADKVGRQLAEAGLERLPRAELETLAQQSLMDAWRQTAQKLALPGMVASNAVGVATFGTFAKEMADAAAKGDTVGAQQLMMSALTTAAFVAVMAFGPNAARRFLPTPDGHNAAIQSVLRQVRPSPPVARIVPGAALDARLERLAALADGVDKAEYAAMKAAPALFDPVTGEVFVRAEAAASMSDDALAGVLHHEVTHARLHDLPKDLRAQVEAAVVARPDYARRRAALGLSPRASNAEAVQEILSEAARTGEPLLPEGLQRATGLDRPLPLIDLGALRAGAAVTLPEGVFVRRTDAVTPDGMPRTKSGAACTSKVHYAKMAGLQGLKYGDLGKHAQLHAALEEGYTRIVRPDGKVVIARRPGNLEDWPKVVEDNGVLRLVDDDFAPRVPVPPEALKSTAALERFMRENSEAFAAYREALKIIPGGDAWANRELAHLAASTKAGALLGTARHNFHDRTQAAVVGWITGGKTAVERRARYDAFTANLNSSYRGSLAEQYYLRLVDDPTLGTHPQLVGRTDTPDFATKGGGRLGEVKSTKGRLGTDEVTQVEDMLEAVYSGDGIDAVVDGVRGTYKSYELAFTDVRGLRANADQVVEWMDAHKEMVLSVVDSQGRRWTTTGDELLATAPRFREGFRRWLEGIE